jgi:hypothetical protein
MIVYTISSILYVIFFIIQEILYATLFSLKTVVMGGRQEKSSKPSADTFLGHFKFKQILNFPFKQLCLVCL